MKQVATLAYQQLQEKQSLEKVLQQVTQVAPRVGKRFFQEGPIIQEVQKMFSEVVFCKGADRRRPLPKEMEPQHAPLRRTLGSNRKTLQGFCDDQWAEWPTLKRKQLIRNCQPSRVLVTVFAKARSTPEASDGNLLTSSSRPFLKRVRLNEPGENASVQQERCHH